MLKGQKHWEVANAVFINKYCKSVLGFELKNKRKHK